MNAVRHSAWGSPTKVGDEAQDSPIRRERGRVHDRVSSDDGAGQPAFAHGGALAHRVANGRDRRHGRIDRGLRSRIASSRRSSPERSMVRSRSPTCTRWRRRARFGMRRCKRSWSGRSGRPSGGRDCYGRSTCFRSAGGLSLTWRSSTPSARGWYTRPCYAASTKRGAARLPTSLPGRDNLRLPRHQ